MLTVYHSNQLELQKELLIHLMKINPQDDPFAKETILVQSQGMAQWLQIQIAQKNGIAANFDFSLPASFIWQQYSCNFVGVTENNEFTKEAMTWRLMGIIPQYIHLSECQSLASYLSSDNTDRQQKCYQLANKVADLFDQYLVYRPEWIEAWEQHKELEIHHVIQSHLRQQNTEIIEQIKQDIIWQGILWRALVNAVQQRVDTMGGEHRANLHHQYLTLLRENKPKNLPSRIFIFGISALPKVYLDTLQAMSQYCDVHFFFNNPSPYYWADLIDEKFLSQLKIKQRIDQQSRQKKGLFSSIQLSKLDVQQFDFTAEQEQLQVGSPLLSSWGKLGRDFLYLLTVLEPNEISSFIMPNGNTLLQQIQQHIYQLTPNQTQPLNIAENDHTLSIHSCHSPMREVEILHDHLLHLFQKDPQLTPKDIVVMMADIDQYIPYIQVVFGQYQHYEKQADGHYVLDTRYIPFSISDNKFSANNSLVSAFFSLLNLNETLCSAEEILALLEIASIRERFALSEQDLSQVRYWVEQVGIRFGLEKEAQNYNAWQSGLERMLLGYAMREENGIWQDCLGFDASYGLKGQIIGQLAEFIAQLQQWKQSISQQYDLAQWRELLLDLLERFFVENNDNINVLVELKNSITQLSQQPFGGTLGIDVIVQVFTEKLAEVSNSLKFLSGQVSFCTLLPMRAIPFKVVCLLGMNDGDYPRKQTRNSFDLMQYDPQKGDRFRRDDDRYLFLEALLSAQQQLYISYVGRSIIDNREREPSVLVAQLIDYIVENSGVEREALIHQETMTIFSPENFLKANRSFARQWLPAWQDQLIADFNQVLHEDEFIASEVIELDQLIKFVQNPVRFFFEKRLGVYFQQEDESIPEHENFTLNPLIRYQLRAALLDNPTQEASKLDVKGVLPRAEFGQVYWQKLHQDIALLKAKIQPYLTQYPQVQYVELNFPIEKYNVKLRGNINQLYGVNKQRIDWRVGDIRDQDRIKNWIYYLALVASSEEDIVDLAKCFGLNSDKTLPQMNKEKSFEQLMVYVRDYCRAKTQLCVVPTEDIEKYLRLLSDESAVDFEKCLAHLSKLAEGSDFKGDLYLQRVLAQTKLDFITINQRVKSWFEDLFSPRKSKVKGV